MLKITVRDTVGSVRWELGGKLAWAWGCDLEHCWHTATARHPSRWLSVDLAGITFTDQAVWYLLQ
jgi:hypothetical protein